MVSTTVLAQLAAATYNTTGTIYGWSRLPDLPPENLAGYDGAAYINTTTGEIVIAHRGTEPLARDGDISSNLQMLRGQLPNQYQYAQQFLDTVTRANPTAPITLTGHSLGGSLAQLQGAVTGLPTVTFNPVGTAGLLPGLNLDPNDAVEKPHSAPPATPPPEFFRGACLVCSKLAGSE